ncbi:hypothetical protein J6590_025715 [Homalodisca vitripennis]|nr:hypothetical protein J6590_025715 [Homalodisca vitripennis]
MMVRNMDETYLVIKNKIRRGVKSSMVLIKSATVTDRIETSAISNSDSKSKILDRVVIYSEEPIGRKFQHGTQLYSKYKIVGQRIDFQSSTSIIRGTAQTPPNQTTAHETTKITDTVIFQPDRRNRRTIRYLVPKHICLQTTLASYVRRVNVNTVITLGADASDSLVVGQPPKAALHARIDERSPETVMPSSDVP